MPSFLITSLSSGQGTTAFSKIVTCCVILLCLLSLRAEKENKRNGWFERVVFDLRGIIHYIMILEKIRRRCPSF